MGVAAKGSPWGKGAQGRGLDEPVPPRADGGSLLHLRVGLVCYGPHRSPGIPAHYRSPPGLQPEVSGGLWPYPQWGGMAGHVPAGLRYRARGPGLAGDQVVVTYMIPMPPKGLGEDAIIV